MSKARKIEIFRSADGTVELTVTMGDDTAWLTQRQIIELFDRDQSVISRHINNVFRDGELLREGNMQKMHIAHSDKPVALYSLDVIISVGYRVKSQRGVQFRQWATKTLKQHLLDGYTLNQRRLLERGVEFEQAVNLLTRTLVGQQLVSEQGEAVIRIIQDYARTWSLLQGYDAQTLLGQETQQMGMRALTIEDAQNVISRLRSELIDKGEATELFAQSRNNGLASALATIEQGFGDELYYPNVAMRAAHLLYFIIKDHPFADGNKRTASFLFIWYLRMNQHLLDRPVEVLINDNTLVALTLLVAESMPQQKTLMIRLIEQLILIKEV